MNGKVVIGCDLDTTDFSAEIDYVKTQLEEIERKLKDADMGLEVGDTQKLEAQYSRLSKKLSNLNKKQAEFNNNQSKMNDINLNAISGKIENINKGITKSIKSVGRWALAFMGVRGIINIITSSMSTLSQYDTNLENRLNSIKIILASIIEPVVRRLVDLAYKLLSYINVLAYAWFKVDLFAKANEIYLKKNNKQAKNLLKTFSKFSFDEFETLEKANQSQSTSGTTNGSGFIPPENVPIPGWLDWLSKNGDKIIGILIGIGGGLLAVKLGLDPLKSLGIGIALKGIYNTIKDIKYLMEDPTWEKVNKLFGDIGETIFGIGITTGNLPAIVIGAGMKIVSWLIENWDKIEEKAQEVEQKIEDTFNYLFGGDLFGPLLSSGFLLPFRFAFEKVKGYVAIVKNAFKALASFLKGDWKKGLEYTFKAIGNVFIRVLNTIITGMNAFLAPLRLAITAVGKVLGKNWSFAQIKIPKIQYLRNGGIINLPGKGVPLNYGQARGGEGGAEGVIPLTNAQQMELLGQSIGKYVNINLTNITKLDNRQISREQKRINAQNDFAFNR